MKTTFVLIFLLFAVMVMNSCKTTIEKNELTEFTQLKNIKNGTKVFIIPGSGCTGCISDVENYAINNKNSDTLYFIFTRLKSVKLFRNRFGNSFVESKNIILDTGNTYQYKDNKMDIYPVMYKMENEKIILVNYLKPSYH